MTGCGETNERPAARSHQIVAPLYGLAIVTLAGALVGEVVMYLWHRASIGIHIGRAIAQGE